MPATLSARLASATSSGSGDVINLAKLVCSRTIVETTDGRSYALIDGSRYWVQLRYDGARVIGDDATVVIEIEGLWAARRRLDAAHQLLKLYRGRHRPISAIRQKAKEKRLADALTALDIKTAGGSYIDIALAIEGEEAVRRYWGGGQSYLKERARRALRRGERYMYKDYRKLLTMT